MKLETLHHLFIDELQDLYSVETQLIEALPKMAEKAQSPELKRAFETHLQQTRRQKERLDQIFDQIQGVDRDDKTCKGMKGIIDENEKMIKDAKDADVRDAGMIAGAQRVEHYEISGYGTARTYAQLLNRPEVARLLQETLDEEKETDRLLNGIAERINIEAKAA
ncbi:MAG: ferritin-like domain-containing protein [Terriglobales bacterium]